MATTASSSTSTSQPLPLDSRSLLVLHASVTGTAVDVAERIGRRARREGWAVQVKSVAQFNPVSTLTGPWEETFECADEYKVYRWSCSSTASSCLSCRPPETGKLRRSSYRSGPLSFTQASLPTFSKI